MNKTFFYLALMLCASFAISCGSDDDDPIVPPTNEEQKDPQKEDPSEIAAKKMAEFKDSLCSNVKYVDRQSYKSAFSFTPTYDIIQSQTDYMFNADGTGVKKYIELTTTDQGFLSNEEKFTWSVSDNYSIKITPENNVSYTWHNVSVDNHELKSSSISLLREVLFDEDKTDPSVFESYSIENLYTYQYSSERTAKGYFVAPCLLTLHYKDGRVTRFIYSNKNARGAIVPFSYVSNTYTFKDSKLYLLIGFTGDDELMYPFFSEKDETITKGHYYIPIGSYDSKTDLLTPIKDNVKYDFPI